MACFSHFAFRLFGLFISLTVIIEPTVCSPINNGNIHSRIQHSIFATLQETADLYGWQNVQGSPLYERSVRSTTDENNVLQQTLQLATELGSVLESQQNLFESATGDHYKKYIKYAKLEASKCKKDMAEIEELTAKWGRIMHEIHETLLIIKDHVERRKGSTDTLTPAVAMTTSVDVPPASIKQDSGTAEGSTAKSSQQNHTAELAPLMQSVKQSEKQLKQIINAIEQTRNDFSKGFVFNMTEQVNNLTSVFNVEIEPLVAQIDLRGLKEDSKEQLVLLDHTLKTLITNALALHRRMKASLDRQLSLESLKELRILMQNFHNLYEEVTKNSTADTDMIMLKAEFNEKVLKQYVRYNDMPKLMENTSIEKLCNLVKDMIKTLKFKMQENIDSKLIADDLKLSQETYSSIKLIVSKIKKLEKDMENELNNISKDQEFSSDMSTEFDRLRSEFQSQVNLKFESFADNNFRYGSSEELKTLKMKAVNVENSLKEQYELLKTANKRAKLHPSYSQFDKVTAGLFTQLAEIIQEFSQQYEHTLSMAKNLTNGEATGYNEILVAELTEFDDSVRTLYDVYRSNENNKDFTDEDLRNIISIGKKRITNLNLIKHNISNELLKMTAFKADNQEFVALMDELIAKIEGFNAMKLDVENFLKDSNLPDDIQKGMIKQKEQIDADSHDVLSKYEEMKKISDSISSKELEDLKEVIFKAENIFTSMENLRQILEKKTVTEMMDKEVEEFNEEQVQKAINNEIGQTQGIYVTGEPSAPETFTLPLKSDSIENPSSMVFSEGSSDGLLPNEENFEGTEGEMTTSSVIGFAGKSANEEEMVTISDLSQEAPSETIDHKSEQKDKIIAEINTSLEKYNNQKDQLNAAYNNYKSQLTAEFRAYFEKRMTAINEATSSLVMGEFDHLKNGNLTEEPNVDEMTNLQLGAEHMYKLIMALQKRLMLKIEKIEDSPNGTIAAEGKRSAIH